MLKPYEGSHQQYDVICQSDTMITMRDGVRLATDIYFPALNGQRMQASFPVILERTPYDKATAGNVMNGSYFARRALIWRGQFIYYY